MSVGRLVMVLQILRVAGGGDFCFNAGIIDASSLRMTGPLVITRAGIRLRYKSEFLLTRQLHYFYQCKHRRRDQFAAHSSLQLRMADPGFNPG